MMNGDPNLSDPRNVLISALDPLKSLNLKMVVATELEFYLIKPGNLSTPEPFVSKIPEKIIISIENNNENTNKGTNLSFGDDYEVPAYLRDRK